MSKKSTSSKAGVTYRTKSRRNGWSCPPHPLQFVAWAFIAIFAVMFHGMAVPTIPYHWQPACHMIAGVVLAAHVVTHLVCLTINPADPNTLRRLKKAMPEFDRTQHKHVIENNHCYLCEVDVGLKSKHCSSCNKCVADFDHHCKWLNNCVGSRNYRWFITCLSSAFLCCLFVFTVFLYLSVVYWVNPKLLHPELYDVAVTARPPVTVAIAAEVTTAQLLTNSVSPTTVAPNPLDAYRAGLRIFGEVSGTAFFVVAIIITVLLLVTLFLLGHLLGFHLYLICHNMSTYDYVMRDRNAFMSGNVEAQQKQPKTKGCCKCHNQVAPLPADKDEIEMTDTKKDSTTSQLESNNNSNSNLQQQLVISEPLIKQEQQQPQQQQQENQETQSVAVTDSKPKSKKKKKSKRKAQRLRSLTSREALQPALMGPPGYPPSQMNLAHSMPQTYLEQHLVRRFSLPLVTPAGMHPQYPVAEPVEDLFFTQQFPTVQRPLTNPQDGQPPQWRPIPPPATISFDSPTPALDYHSSSAESLVEIPVSRVYHRGSISNPVQRPLRPDGYQLANGYRHPSEKWNPNHSSHPNLTMNGNQWRSDLKQLGPGATHLDSNTNSVTHSKKSKRTARTKKGDELNGSANRRLNEMEMQRRDSIQEPLLVKTAQVTESQRVPDRLDPKGNSGKKAKKQRSPGSVETTAEVHHQLDHSELASNDAEVDGGSHLQDQTRSETRTQVQPPKGFPVAAPRRRTLKLGQEPLGSQTSLHSSSSRQHLLEDADRDGNPPSSGLSRKEQLQEDSCHDAVSLPGSIPEVPPLDLGPLANTQDSNTVSVTQRSPSDHGSLSDDQLVKSYSEDVDSKPVSRRRSLLLRY